MAMSRQNEPKKLLLRSSEATLQPPFLPSSNMPVVARELYDGAAGLHALRVGVDRTAVRGHESTLIPGLPVERQAEGANVDLDGIPVGVGRVGIEQRFPNAFDRNVHAHPEDRLVGLELLELGGRHRRLGLLTARARDDGQTQEEQEDPCASGGRPLRVVFGHHDVIQALTGSRLRRSRHRPPPLVRRRHRWQEFLWGMAGFMPWVVGIAALHWWLNGHPLDTFYHSTWAESPSRPVRICQ